MNEGQEWPKLRIWDGWYGTEREEVANNMSRKRESLVRVGVTASVVRCVGRATVGLSKLLFFFVFVLRFFRTQLWQRKR